MRAKSREERSQSTKHNCPDCKGTGFEMVKQPTRPGVRVYPAQCKGCLGKGRVAGLTSFATLASVLGELLAARQWRPWSSRRERDGMEK